MHQILLRINMNIFSEIHADLPREGPGCNEVTREAFSRISPIPRAASILDIGCGPGIHTLELSRLFSSKEGIITATDINIEYLEALRKKIEEQKIDNIALKEADMFNLSYDDSSFDIIWAEGAIFIIGFEKGLREWRRLLKPDGIIVVSELSWLKNDMPQEIIEFWAKSYPRMQSIENNIITAEQCGYCVDSHFTIPEFAWFDDYYTPMENRIRELTEKYKGNEEAQLLLSNSNSEIEMYKRYSPYYGYQFYILRPTGAQI